MGDVLEPRGQVFGATLPLAERRVLALDRQEGGGYVGWAVYATADLDGEPERLHNVTVAEAVDLAPEGRELILTATLDAIAVLRIADGAGQPASEVAVRQSERLVDELVEAGQPRATVLSVARRLSRAHLVARDLRSHPERETPRSEGTRTIDEQLHAEPMRVPRSRWASLPLSRLAAAAGALVLLVIVGLLVLGPMTGSPSKRQGASTKPSSSVSAPPRTPPAEQSAAPQTRPSTPPVGLSAIGAWDPYGDGREHGDKASAAEDGNAGTYWPTETYIDGLQKPGVGLLLDAGRAVQLRRLVVTTDTPGYSALIEAGSASSGPFQPISSARTVGTRAVFSLGAHAQRYYLIWIRRLDHIAHVNEVRAFGY